MLTLHTLHVMPRIFLLFHRFLQHFRQMTPKFAGADSISSDAAGPTYPPKATPWIRRHSTVLSKVFLPAVSGGMSVTSIRWRKPAILILSR
ncbi:hypothetical protein JGC56_04280 [Salmonella enterica subsp. enterica serovar Saintpaul]|nr:hypothetical protein [Salmonella enterica subsp. enterica serovar Saintpaul]